MKFIGKVGYRVRLVMQSVPRKLSKRNWQKILTKVKFRCSLKNGSQ